MVLGMSIETYTLFHVLISFAGIISGIVVVYGFLTANRMGRWNAFFLVTTVATSLTGFGFPFEKLLPAHIVGAISLVVLVIAVFAMYVGGLSGAWRWIYVITATLALYLNVFVLVVQSFLKVPALKELAPKQSEPPFVAAQVVLMVVYIVFTVLSVKKFHPELDKATA